MSSCIAKLIDALHLMPVRFFDEATGVFIIRCKRESSRSIWAALTLLSSLEGQQVSVSVLDMSSKYFPGMLAKMHVC